MGATAASGAEPLGAPAAPVAPHAPGDKTLEDLRAASVAAAAQPLGPWLEREALSEARRLSTVAANWVAELLLLRTRV